jgi:hypothetical protein
MIFQASKKSGYMVSLRRLLFLKTNHYFKPVKITKTFIYFSLLLTALYLIQWWLLFYYFPNVPKYIPETNINIAGLVLAITILPVVYFFLKSIYQQQRSVNLIQLTSLGILLAIVTEILFQIVRQSLATISLTEKILESVKAVIIMAAVIGSISFITAFKLKHPKSVWNTIFWVLFFAIVYVLKEYTSVLPQ